MGRYIDLDKLNTRLPVVCVDDGDSLVSMADVRKALLFAEAETGDVAETTRCKECRFYGVDRNKGGFCMRPWSPSMWRDETGSLKPDDFCSYAVRKEQT